MNPFVINGIIPDRYFCDRVKETGIITRALLNQTNILLTSPRRMGKTQLIRHIFSRPEIKDNYYTFYTDIYATTGLQELVMYLSREIYSQLVPFGRKAFDSFLSVVRSISAGFSYSPMDTLPSFELNLGDIRTPELTISEIFEYLEKADRHCIFAIDEFQRIGDYPQKNMEALLRTHIQKMTNCSFIFSGSNRHILENMFNTSSKPFYNSASQCYLDRIDRGVYIDFIIKCFSSDGRTIMPDAAALAYDLFDGHTYYVHRLLHDIYSYMDKDRIVDVGDVREMLANVLEEQSHSFSDQMSLLSFQQKETLVAIAKEGQTNGVTSAAFTKKYSLQSPSSVQNALRTLLDRELVTFESAGRSKTYSVSNRFLVMWIKNNY